MSSQRNGIVKHIRERYLPLKPVTFAKITKEEELAQRGVLKKIKDAVAAVFKS